MRDCISKRYNWKLDLAGCWLWGGVGGVGGVCVCVFVWEMGVCLKLMLVVLGWLGVMGMDGIVGLEMCSAVLTGNVYNLMFYLSMG